MRQFAVFTCLLVVCIRCNVSATMIRHTTGLPNTVGGLVPQASMTNGGAPMPSFVVGGLGSPIQDITTQIPLSLAGPAIITGFAGVFWAEEPSDYLDPDASPQDDPIRDLTTHLVLHCSLATAQESPLMGDVNVPGLQLKMSATLGLAQNNTPTYYVKYALQQPIKLAAGDYFVSLVTESVAGPCGWVESFIDTSDDLWTDSGLPGQHFKYSDSESHITACAGVDIHGYLLDEPMCLRNVLGDQDDNPSSPPARCTVDIATAAIAGDLESNLRSFYLPADERYIISTADLDLDHTVRITGLYGIGLFEHDPPEDINWHVTIYGDQGATSALDAFERDPLHGNVVADILIPQAKQTDIQRCGHALTYLALSFDQVLAPGAYQIAVYAEGAYWDFVSSRIDGGPDFYAHNYDAEGRIHGPFSGDEYYDFALQELGFDLTHFTGTTALDIWGEILADDPPDLMDLTDACAVPGPQESGAIAHWKMDEHSGTTAYDLAGTQDGMVYGATWTTGRIDGALAFDGVDDYIDCGNNDALAPTFFTISMWINSQATSSSRSVLRKAGTDARDKDFEFELFAARHPAFSFGNGSKNTVLYSGSEFPLDEWIHVTLTRDQTEAAIYINGLQLMSSPYNFTPSATDHKLIMGGGSYKAFKGKIDDVQIYDTVLTPEEIEDLYDNVP
jgi:hypothetical protein